MMFITIDFACHQRDSKVKDTGDTKIQRCPEKDIPKLRRYH